MRIFIAAVVLIFSLQSLSKAEDIRDFEIEGMSIGESLLDHFSKNEILENKQKIQYPNDKFIVYKLAPIKNLIQYNRFTVSVKKHDKNYIIAAVTGGIGYSNLNECIKLKKEFSKEFEKLFPNINGREVEYKAAYDKSGKSKVIGIEYSFLTCDSMVANCNDWSENVKLNKSFQVSMRTQAFSYFLINEAYK